MKSLSVTTLIAQNFMLYTFVHYALQYCEAYFTNWISEHFVCIVISNRFVTFLQQHRSIYLKSILCKQWNLYPIAKKDSNQLRQKNCQMFFLSCPWKNPLLLTLWYLLFVALKTHTLMQSKAVCWKTFIWSYINKSDGGSSSNECLILSGVWTMIRRCQSILEDWSSVLRFRAFSAALNLALLWSFFWGR